MEPLKILFVCLGNTCRSPMAEAVLTDMLKKQQLNWTVDSAGLRDWNLGILPNERTVKVLNNNGITIQHTGRMIAKDDFYNYDYILAMDYFNMSELLTIAEALDQPLKCKIELLGSYLDNEQQNVIRDPYFSPDDATFLQVFLQISESCKRFVTAKCPTMSLNL